MQECNTKGHQIRNLTDENSGLQNEIFKLQINRTIYEIVKEDIVLHLDNINKTFNELSILNCQSDDKLLNSDFHEVDHKSEKLFLNVFQNTNKPDTLDENAMCEMKKDVNSIIAFQNDLEQMFSNINTIYTCYQDCYETNKELTEENKELR